MGFTVGGEIGRARKAKGWILYRLEDEREAASDRYAQKLDEEIERTRAEPVGLFNQRTKAYTLRERILRAQRAAEVIGQDEWLKPPLSPAVREAVGM